MDNSSTLLLITYRESVCLLKAWSRPTSLEMLIFLNALVHCPPLAFNREALNEGRRGGGGAYGLRGHTGAPETAAGQLCLKEGLRNSHCCGCCCNSVGRRMPEWQAGHFLPFRNRSLGSGATSFTTAAGTEKEDQRARPKQ